MIVCQRSFQFIEERFDLTVRFEGVMCLIACGLRLLEESIQMCIFHDGMKLRLTLQLAKEPPAFRGVRLIEAALDLVKQRGHRLVIPSQQRHEVHGTSPDESGEATGKDQEAQN
jgi:hypothetical protein